MSTYSVFNGWKQLDITVEHQRNKNSAHTHWTKWVSPSQVITLRAMSNDDLCTFATVFNMSNMCTKINGKWLANLDAGNITKIEWEKHVSFPILMFIPCWLSYFLFHMPCPNISDCLNDVKNKSKVFQKLIKWQMYASSEFTMCDEKNWTRSKSFAIHHIKYKRMRK